ncbi:MAG: hypothetical protein WAW96_11695, partial [Alphaproteobacteria bacterium]
MDARNLQRTLKAGALFALSAAAVATLYDSFIRAPAARAEAASVLDPVATSNAHCSGMGFARSGSMLGPGILMVEAKKSDSKKGKGAPAPKLPGEDVPIMPGLGNYSYRVSVNEPLAQAYFDQ